MRAASRSAPALLGGRTKGRSPHPPPAHAAVSRGNVPCSLPAGVPGARSPGCSAAGQVGQGGAPSPTPSPPPPLGPRAQALRSRPILSTREGSEVGCRSFRTSTLRTNDPALLFEFLPGTFTCIIFFKTSGSRLGTLAAGSEAAGRVRGDRQRAGRGFGREPQRNVARSAFPAGGGAFGT